MLHEFIFSNLTELTQRCRRKGARRFEPSPVPVALDQGVTLVLTQIADSLRLEQSAANGAVPAATDHAIKPAANLHGAALLRAGYSIDQVVHEYGDVCQAVTELAIEQQTSISTNEFRILNRCLDNAIAGAVMSFGHEGQARTEERAQGLHDRLDTFSSEHQRLVQIAAQSFTAIKTGDVGLSGATGTLLMHALEELRLLTERTRPEIRLKSDATTATSR